MTFYHFANCLLLTFGPPIILYKFSVLSEFETIWRPAIGVLAYIVTQMGKMLIIAGFMNLTPFWEHIIDCIGMYYFMVHHQKANMASVKILSLALGWSFADSLFTRLINFYINARSLQFEWLHLISAGEANLVLIQNICICALLWHWNRKSSKIYPILVLSYILIISLLQLNLVLKSGTLLCFCLFTLILLR